MDIKSAWNWVYENKAVVTIDGGVQRVTVLTGKGSASAASRDVNAALPGIIEELQKKG